MAPDSMSSQPPSPPARSSDVLSSETLLSERGWLRRLSVSLVGPANADDVAQEAWLALLERQRRSSSGMAVEDRRGWLAGAVRNLALASQRKRASRLGHEHMYAEGVAAGDSAGMHASAGALAEQAELQSEVVAHLLNLKDPIRATLLLRYQGGLTAAEIARRFGLPAGTVRRRIKEGLDSLREQMDTGHGGRKAWAPALVGVLPEVLKASLLSSGSGMAAWTALISMKKVMLLLAVALIAGAGWMVSSGMNRDVSLPEARAMAGTDSPIAPGAEAGREALLTSPESGARGAVSEAKVAAPALTPSYRVVNEAGEDLSIAAMVAVFGEEKQTLQGSGGSFSLDESIAERLAGRTTVALVTSREGSWPHTFEAPLAGGVHTLVWPKGVTLHGQLRVQGQRPGEPVRMTLRRDVGWSGRPHAAKVDDRTSPIPKSVFSDEDGHFVLADLPLDWRGWLKIEKAWRFEGGSRKSSTIEASGPRDFEWAIERSPRIIGRVLDEGSGRALADQRVQVVETWGAESIRYSEAGTESDGHFVWFPDARATEVEFGFGIYGGLSTRSLGGVVPPEFGTLDLGDVALEELVQARFLVVDGGGQPVEGARLREQGQQQGAEATAESAADGTVQLSVQSPGSASIEVRAEGFEAALYRVSGLSADVATVIELRPELRFELRVQDGDGEPVPGCQVTFEPRGLRPDGLSVFNTRGGELTAGTVTRISNFMDGREISGFSTDEAGRIEVGGLALGVTVQCGFMEDMQWLEAPVVISADANGRWKGTLVDPRVRLPEVTGIVTAPDGSPIADANVKFPSSLMASYVRTDEYGAFSAPVRWRRGRSSLTVTAPGFTKLHHSLELDSLGSEPLKLTLQKGRTLEVQLVDPSGAPISGESVAVSLESSAGQWKALDQEVSDLEGVCHFTDLAAGKLRLTSQWAGARYRALVPSGAVQHRFQLEAPATVVVDWSALEGDPSRVVLRSPRREGEPALLRIADDRVASHKIEAGSTDSPGASFTCAPGAYEIVALTDRSEQATKVLATAVVTAVAGETSRVVLK